jgi:uncharacterized ParB-like nuclease family protein
MASKNLKIDQLKLDLLNPRIGKVDNQHAAMQAMADEQGVKLANLAESIVDEGGLNPMDVLLVLKDDDGRYIALEGNRRTLALKLLINPAAMTGLAIPSATQKRVEAASKRFDRTTVEPVRCFEMADRAAAATWIDQRHRGEDEGRGIVRWSSEAGRRFSEGDPALQALDFVRIVPKGCQLKVTSNRIGEIYKELMTLKLATHRNAIAVLYRVFTELSVDHYLVSNKKGLKYEKDGKKYYKSLKNKIEESIALMTVAGADTDDFKGIKRALSNSNDSLSIDLQHAYVHNRNLTPSESDLVLAWNNAEAFFGNIWK